MLEIRRTDEFDEWLRRLKDRTGRNRILIRIRRLALGNPGDVRPIGGGVGELRIDHGPGYRVYFTQRGAMLVLVLCGGDKASQDRDIRHARELAAELER